MVKVLNISNIMMNAGIRTSVLSMHLIASHINFVLILKVAMSVNANLVSKQLEANALMSTNVRTGFIFRHKSLELKKLLGIQRSHYRVLVEITFKRVIHVLIRMRFAIIPRDHSIAIAKKVIRNRDPRITTVLY